MTPAQIIDFPAPGEPTTRSPVLSEVSRLDFAEAALSDALAEADRNSWKAIFLLYSIYKSALWREGFDDDGEPFANFETYISSLRGRIPRLGIRWAQDLISALTMCLEVLDIDREVLVKCSPSSIRDIKKLVVWDQKRKEIKDYNVAGGKSEVLRLIDDAATPGVRPSDVRTRVYSALNKSSVTFTWEEHSGAFGPYVLNAFHDDLSYQIRLSPLYGRTVPSAVVNEIRKKLGCLE